MMILRDIIMSREARSSDVIFVNMNGEQQTFHKQEERGKEILTMLGGKMLIPTGVKHEYVKNGLDDCDIYESDSLGIVITFINYAI